MRALTPESPEPPRRPVVLAAAATGIVDFIEEQGGDIDRIFGHAGIAPVMAGEPTLKLELAAFCRLFELAARQTRNDNFGLWFGNAFRPRDLGLWGYAALSAPTLGAALDSLVGLFHYHQQSSTMRLRRDESGLMRLEYRIETPDIVERRQDAELSLGMFLNVLRDACGAGWSPAEVHFEHPEPEERAQHRAAFGAPICFSRPTNALLFRPELLAKPMPGRDPALQAIMEVCLKQLGGAMTAPASLVDRVRIAIRARLARGYPTLDEVGEDLRLTPASLQRELAGAGARYRDLVETTRRELALAYLRRRGLPLSEIAFLLGYSELSAFSRAVRRWTGEAPRTVRARLLDA